MYLKTTLAATALVMSGLAASAATMINVQTFSTAAYDAYVANRDVLASEDFEGFDAEVEGNLPVTGVGSFTQLGTNVGSGGSVVGSGEELAVRDGLGNISGFGRTNTTVGGKNWLDSNDTDGIVWNATIGGGLFDEVAFALSDAADLGATLSVIANGDTLTTLIGQGNGTVNWVVVSFMDSVGSANITLSNNMTNDGFGIDDATIASVPLPAGILLLGTALGGLGIARRRKNAKADA